MKIVFYHDGGTEAAVFLRELGIQFEEVDVRSNSGLERLRKRTQQSSVPVFELKKSHSIRIIDGSDKQTLIQELGLVFE